MTSRRLRQALTATALAGAAALAGLGVAKVVGSPAPRALAARAHALETELRCPVCQGLSVADSPSQLATGMRQIILAQLAAGRSPAQIRRYFTARYGSWVLLDPPNRGIGWLAWLTPLVGLAGGAGGIGWLLCRRAGPPIDDTPLTTELRADVEEAASRRGADDDDEELGAALALLAAVRDDPTGGRPAETYAMRRVAAALNENQIRRPLPQRVSASPAQPAGPLAQPSFRPPASPAGHRWPRRLGLALSGGGFAVGLVLALGAALSHRTAGAPPTGTAPDPMAGLRATALAHPRDPVSWLALGLAEDADGNLTAAYTDYRHAADVDPADLQAQLLLASVLVRGGSPADAVRVLTPLLTSHPNDPVLLLAAGLAERVAGDPRATATLRRYLVLDPRGSWAAQVRDLLAGK